MTCITKGTLFKRKTLLLKNKVLQQSLKNPLLENERECQALIINSSHEMASEITMQICLRIQNCSIMYAPSLQLAAWILKKHKVNLVVSSPVLPDGGIQKLSQLLNSLESPPDLVVVGKLDLRNATILNNTSYKFNSVRHLAKKERNLAHEKTKDLEIQVVEKEKSPHLMQSIKNLGADLRNDLNNPLQEIVAMAFVAKASGQISATTLHAIEAIDKAAQSMAKVVSKLEDQMLKVVEQ